MKWYLNRKVNYYPFDTYLVNLGYIIEQEKNFGAGLKNTFYYYRDRVAYCYRGQKDLDNIAKLLNKEFNRKFIDEYSKKIKLYSKQLLKETEKAFTSKKDLINHFKKFCEVHKNLFSLLQLPEYCQLFLPHLNKKLLIKFGMSRDYAIKRLIKVEKIYRDRLGKLLKLSKITALMLLPDEIENILNKDKIPKNLKSRKTFALHTKECKIKVYWNKEADKIYKKLINIKRLNIKRLKGQISYKGNYKGKAYIALKQDDFKHIPKGAVLICSMTRYDIVHYLNKVGAIVTDQGGITCHAAIIARELKIPTIIGTQNATDTFKTGELVEVNTNKGIVKKL